MSTFIVNAKNSFDAKEGFLTLLSNGFVPQNASINYNFNKGLSTIEKVEDYPLCMHGMLQGVPAVVRINSVTAGYNGTGPNILMDILKAAGFTVHADDILSKKRAEGNQIRLVYLK